MGNNLEQYYSMKDIIECFGVSRDAVLDRVGRRNMFVAKIGKLWEFEVSEAYMKCINPGYYKGYTTFRAEEL